MTITPPAAVSATITSLFGQAGRDWLAALPDLVDELCRRWRLTLAGPAFEGGTYSYAVPVHGPDGPAVLKVPVLDDENYAESAALRCYAGDGAVRLYAVDPASGAMLLETAPGRPLLDLLVGDELPLARIVEIAGGLLRGLRRVPSGDLTVPSPGVVAGPDAIVAAPTRPFPRVTDLARRWSVELPRRYEAMGRPGDRRPFDEAAELAAAYAAGDGVELLVNRDGHTGNILGGPSPDRPWLLIDPKPLVGEPAFDAGHLLWDLFAPEPTTRRAAYLVPALADALAVDPERVRGWALLRAVSNLTWAIGEGVAGPYLALADLLRTG